MSESEYLNYRQNWWISLNKSGNTTEPMRKRSDFNQALSTLNRLHREAGGRQLKTHTLLEVQTMEIVVEFFLHLVAMERILVVFLRFQRKSTKEDYDRTVRPVVYRSLAKTSRIHSILLQIDRLQLTAVYCIRREV